MPCQSGFDRVVASCSRRPGAPSQEIVTARLGSRDNRLAVEDLGGPFLLHQGLERAQEGLTAAQLKLRSPWTVVPACLPASEA